MEKEYVTHEEARESLLDTYKVIVKGTFEVNVSAKSIEEAEDKALDEIESSVGGYFVCDLEIEEVE
jgi:ribosomal protein L15